MFPFSIAIASDHAGIDLKAHLVASLKSAGHTVEDLGPDSHASVDYPNYAHLVTDAIGFGRVDYGILVCGSGLGMCIAANKVKGIRAGVAHMEEYAKLLRQHNNANVLCIGARFVASYHADLIVKAFLEAEFEGGNHARRVALLEA